MLRRVEKLIIWVKKRQHCFFLSLIIIFGLHCSKGLFKYYAFFTHDGDHHIARSFDAIETLKEGHFPLRWAGSLNGRCGVPIFNFFYPLIYYLVFLINFLTGDVIISLKIIDLLSLTLGPAFFYLWLEKETNDKFSSFVAAFLYLFVPYRFLLVYVRGTPEFLSYTIFPLVLYFFTPLLEKNVGRKFWISASFTSFFGGLFVISHNFVVMLLFPLLVAFSLFKILKNNLPLKRMIIIVFILVSIIGLGAFFIGPAWLEKNYVKLDTLGTINYLDHFPTLKQLIRSPWGYGYSGRGLNDGMSFMLGYAQWVVLIIAVVYLINNLKVKKEVFFPEIVFWLAISLFTIFLILPWSIFVWKRIWLLQSLQFSWRFLGVTSFAISALAGYLFCSLVRKKYFFLLALLIILLAFYGNRNHLLPQPVLNIDKYNNFELLHEHRYSTTTFMDDILNKESEKECNLESNFLSFYPLDLEVTYQMERRNTFGEVAIISKEEKITGVRLNLEFFPKIFKITINGKKYQDYLNCKGKVCLNNIVLNKGKNVLQWRVVQTPTERLFNLISLTFVFVWLFILGFALIKSFRYG